MDSHAIHYQEIVADESVCRIACLNKGQSCFLNVAKRRDLASITPLIEFRVWKMGPQFANRLWVWSPLWGLRLRGRFRLQDSLAAFAALPSRGFRLLGRFRLQDASSVVPLLTSPPLPTPLEQPGAISAAPLEQPGAISTARVPSC